MNRQDAKSAKGAFWRASWIGNGNDHISRRAAKTQGLNQTLQAILCVSAPLRELLLVLNKSEAFARSRRRVGDLPCRDLFERKNMATKTMDHRPAKQNGKSEH